ncbi:YicC family protein [Candidatus Acetothermia bacterium]|nr:YicC family protein [Candidatus Acetothermia bacterium]
MIKSMTGFGSGKSSQDHWVVTAMIRTVNHRYLSVNICNLRDYPLIATQAEKLVKEVCSRGEVEVRISIESTEGIPLIMNVDKAIAQRYVADLKEICRELSLDDAPRLDHLITLGAFKPLPINEAELWPVIAAALTEAINNLLAAREAEGERLCVELHAIITRLQELTTLVERRIPQLATEMRLRLMTRIKEMELEIDAKRLEEEIVLWVERSDVHEELVRISTHLMRVDELLTISDSIGKELEFLAQEIQREINTLGAKTRDLSIAAVVVKMKLEVDRFKEQVRNVE